MGNWSWGMLSYFLSVGCLSFIMPWHILILGRDRLLHLILFSYPFPPFSEHLHQPLVKFTGLWEDDCQRNAGSEFVTVLQWLWYQVMAVVWYQEDCTSAARESVCVWSARYPSVRRCKCIGDVDTASQHCFRGQPCEPDSITATAQRTPVLEALKSLSLNPSLSPSPALLPPKFTS